MKLRQLMTNSLQKTKAKSKDRKKKEEEEKERKKKQQKEPEKGKLIRFTVEGEHAIQTNLFTLDFTQEIYLASDNQETSPPNVHTHF